MKPKYLKIETQDEAGKYEKNLKSEGLFNGLQKKKQATVEANGNSNQVDPISFDLLNLKLNFEVSEAPKPIEKQSEKVIKSENSNSFLGTTEPKVKLDQGQVSFGYNHALFDAEFPVIAKEEPRIQKQDLKNLEKTLINLDDLDFSLSRSKAPRRLMN
jgi:hypothetical protein